MSYRFRCLVAVLSVLLGALWTSLAAAAAVPVKVVEEDGRYQLYRGGEPYVVRGAGLEFGDKASLAAHGGNAFRTWRTDNGHQSGQEVLDEAQRLGLTVAMCIEIGRERHGFDYDDTAAVARQLEYARGEVLKYKDHPALLAWIIGNEANLNFRNPKVFDAIGDIAKMIHEVDGQHPTTTALAGFSGDLAGLIGQRAPELDFVSIQMYGDLVNLPRILDEIGYDRPYMVTEWGAIGHWEVRKTAWDAPVEQNSSDKAQNYLKSYLAAIESDRAHVIGSFVFLWGQKQERTPTWYGIFLADGRETEAVDVMHRVWTGAWPENRAPWVGTLLLDGRDTGSDVVLRAGGRYRAQVMAADPDGDVLRYRWEVMHESKATQQGGDREQVPSPVPGAIASSDGEPGETATVVAPAEPGAYRLFVYVYDDHGHAGHANIPFLVP